MPRILKFNWYVLTRFSNIGSITEIHSGHSVGPQEIRAAVDKRAGQFLKTGIRAGDRVAIYSGNSIGFFIDLLAIWTVGGGAVPLDANDPQKKADLCDAKFDLRSPNDELEIRSQNAKSDFSSAHLVLFTSGTAGTPKGVILGTDQIKDRIQNLQKFIPAEEIKRTLCVLPTHFGHGLIGNSLFPLMTGSDLFIAPAFDAAGIFSLANLVDRYELSFFSSVPSIWKMIGHQSGPLKKSLRRIHCASAPFTEDLYKKISNWAPEARIFNVYGATELGSWISGYEVQSGATPGRVGTGWGVEIKVSAADSSGTGSVLLRSASLMQGYCKLPEETAKKMQGEWFNSGDNGRWDENGLTLLGRTDDLINRAGAKIDPLEIEKLLTGHPSIADSCVFSLPHEITGECVACALVFSPGIRIPEHELETWCRTQLPAYKIPAKWFILDRIPVNSRGKVSRREVRNFCLSQEKAT